VDATMISARPARGAARGALATGRRSGQHPVQRSPGDRGAIVFAHACKLGIEGIGSEARRQPLPERDEPQLAEVLEPGVSAPVKRRGARRKSKPKTQATRGL
jgi:hypothetical protein